MKENDANMFEQMYYTALLVFIFDMKYAPIF